MSTLQVEEKRVQEENPILRYFELGKYNVTVASEVLAGITTFLVMAYIAFVNPSILTSVKDSTGASLDFAATVTATCWVAFALTAIMGLYANRPFAMAPGMGLNAVVTYQLVAGQKMTWPEAMGIIVLEGIIITVLVLTKFREAIIRAVPLDLKRAIAAGIGLFIMYIGFVDGGILSGAPPNSGTPVQLGNFTAPTILVTVFGLVFAAWLHSRGNRASLLISILAATAFAILLNYLSQWLGYGALYDPKSGVGVIPSGVVGLPTLPHFFGVTGWVDAFSKGPITSALDTFSIMLSDFFDTVGTFVGVALLAGFLDANGQLPGIRRPLLVDSIGPIVGGAFGASSATTYIESSAGVQAGGRTGLTSLTTAVLFLLVPFFTPIISVVPAQATAPALILVGFFMTRAVVREINWDDFTIAFPALLTIVVMPLSYSISNGIGFGFILFVLLRGARNRETIHPLMWAAAAAFVLYFLAAPIRLWFGVG